MGVPRPESFRRDSGQHDRLQSTEGGTPPDPARRAPGTSATSAGRPPGRRMRYFSDWCVRHRPVAARLSAAVVESAGGSALVAFQLPNRGQSLG
jgi:hypothetical protein